VQRRDAGVPGDARLIFSIDSPPLADLVRDINKFSNNVMARQLFLTLSAEATGQPGETARSVEVIKAWLKHRGIEAPELVLENGAGLSRVERISAATLSQLLRAAYHSPLFAEFESALPIVSIDGTLKRRFRAADMQGRLRMKTGSLEDVSALAGYVRAASGRTFVTVIILNDPKADGGAGEAIQAALVEWVFGQ